MTISTEKITQVRAAVGSFTDSIVARVTQVQTSIQAGVQHEADENNPHELVKEDVGLSLVENRPIASDADAMAGTGTDYLTVEKSILYLDERAFEVNHVYTPAWNLPVNNALFTDQYPTLEASPYKHRYGLPRAHRQFQVDLYANDYTTPLIDASQDEDSYTVMTPLSYAQYRYRCRDVSEDGQAGDWVEQQFTVVDPAIPAPTITLLNTEAPITITPSFTFSAFDHLLDTHDSTEIELYDGQTLVDSAVLSSAPLTSYTVPVSTLEYGKSYLIKVRYIGASEEVSPWGTLLFDTATLAYDAPTITSSTTGVQFMPLDERERWLLLVRANGVDQVVKTLKYNNKLYHVGFSQAGGQGDRDAMIIRTDLSGVVEDKTLYGTADGEFITDATIVGQYLFLVGYAGSTYDLLIIRYNLASLVWDAAKLIISTNNALSSIKAVTSDNSYLYITGNILGNGAPQAFVAQVSQWHALGWIRYIDTTEQTLFRGIVRNNNYLYAVGQTEINKAGAGADILLQCLDYLGNIQYTKRIHRTVSAGSEIAHAITTDGWYLYIVGQQTSQGPGGISPFIMKVDPFDGTVLWAKTVGDALTNLLTSVTYASGFVYAVGRTNTASNSYDALATCWSLDGDLIWQRAFFSNGTDSFNKVTAIDNRLHMTGYTTLVGTTEGFAVVMDLMGQGTTVTVDGFGQYTPTLTTDTLTYAQSDITPTIGTSHSWTERSATFIAGTSTAVCTKTLL